MPKKLSIALLLVLLSACQTMIIDPIFADCDLVESVIELREDWHFRLDEMNVGLLQEWYATEIDLSNWQTLAAGRPWEQQGIDYDGVAWYRKTIVQEKAQVLFLADIDDSAIVWINGVQATELNAENSMVSVNLAIGENSITLRITDGGGYGGIKSVPLLSDSLEMAVGDRHYAPFFAKLYPQIPYPSWTLGKPLAWTMTGGFNNADEALVSIDGAIAPYADAPTTEIWLYNTTKNQIVSASQTKTQFLLVGDVPIPQWEWRTENVTIRQVLFFDEKDQAVRSRVWINAQNSVDEWQLLLITRNLGVNQSVHRIQSLVTYEGENNTTRQWVNQKEFLVVNKVSQKKWVGQLPKLVETMQAGQTWDYQQQDCDTIGNLASLLQFDLSKNQENVFDFAYPAHNQDKFPPVNIDTGQRLEDAKQFWQLQTSNAQIYIPDSRIQASLSASLGYLLLASDPDGPRPGPLAHDAIWTRDAAYMSLALLMAGHRDIAENYVTAIFSGQNVDGRVPPIQGENIPWTNEEWDAQGQSIFLVTQIYRFTNDLAFLEKWYPNIKKSADYLIQLRQKNLESEEPALIGLLPASLSAEDLGEGEQHYYWDNFWAIAGLEEVAYASRMLGFLDDETIYQAEANQLRDAVLTSIQYLMGENPNYIPVSVETLENSGMARGTVPTLFPYAVFSPQDDLLVRSFTEYYERFIEPHKGGYLHREGQFWTYGGIELAHAYLRLGRGDILHQILGWTLEHQTLPNTYAWAEQVNPIHYGFTGGDMPHAWMAASYYSLIREMVVLEEDDVLALFKGASGNWFNAGNVIAVVNLPTHFGKLNLETESTLVTQDGKWQGTLKIRLSGVQPLKGYYWDLEQLPTILEGAILEGNRLLIEPETTEIFLKFD